MVTSKQQDVVLLDAAIPEEKARWIDTWNRIDDREVQAHPEYAGLFAQPGDRIVCVVIDRAQGGVVLPLVLRPLAREPWAADHETRWDATSPYGYGGPYYWGADETCAADLWINFDQLMQSAGVVATFIRFSLTSGATSSFRGVLQEAMNNIVRRLDISTDELWRDYASKVRKNVRRAQSRGLTVEVDADGARLSDFLDIYYGTMSRRGASESFYFPREFFSGLLEKLSTSAILFHVLAEGAVVSTELVLVSARRMYSFLGGTRQEAFSLRANDLLKHEIICWGQRHKLEEFVLGGGYGYNDGIYKYKQAFAPSGARPFHIGQLTHDQAAVDSLVTRHAAWSMKRGEVWQARADFFPSYRS